MSIYLSMLVGRLGVHPFSLRRFPSFRTQPLENLTPLSMNKWVSEQPSPWRKSSKRKSCYGDRVYTRKSLTIKGNPFA